MPYIHFTEEQKLRANSVDLVEFLRRQGEKLIPPAGTSVSYQITALRYVAMNGMTTRPSREAKRFLLCSPIMDWPTQTR